MRLSRTLRYMVAGGATLALMLGVLGTAHASAVGQGAAESIAEHAVGGGSTVQRISLGSAGGAAVWNVDLRSSGGIWYAVQVAQADGVVMRVQVLGEAPSGGAVTGQSSSSSVEVGSSSDVTASTATDPTPPLPPGPPQPHGPHRPHHRGLGSWFSAPPGWAHRGHHGHVGLGHAKGPSKDQGDGQGQDDAQGD